MPIKTKENKAGFSQPEFRKILLSLLMGILCQMGVAQVYHPMPLSNTYWTGNHFAYYGGGTCSWSNDEGYQTGGDTLINSKTYVKITATYDHVGCSAGCNGSCPTASFGSSYAGAMREDTAGKKVYFVKAANTVEAVLYDFTQNPGDTVNSLLNQNPGCKKQTLLSIDSIQLNDGYHRRFNISNTGCLPGLPVSFIEGIGSTAGLLDQLVRFESGSSLFCVVQNNLLLYPQGTNACQRVTAITNLILPAQTNQIAISPNPCTGGFTLYDEHFEKAVFELYSLSGQLVLRQALVAKQTHVDASTQAKGIYFYRVVSPEQTAYRGKMVIE
jgi:hypothetical protein